MASKETCNSVLQLGDATLHCDLPEDHGTPTGDKPQGSPHQDAAHQDVLSGEPMTWWG